jgi:glycogen synthase
MRILMLGWEFPPNIVGGLGTASEGLTRALDRLGHEVTFVVPQAVGGRARSSPADRLSIEPIAGTSRARLISLPFSVAAPYTPNSAGMAGAATLVEAAARYARLAPSLLDLGPFDLVHAHDWLPFPAAAALASAAALPFVAHVHSLEIDRAGAAGDAAIETIERVGLRTADAVITVSRRERDVCVHHFGLRPGVCTVIYNGVDGPFAQPAPLRRGTPPERTVLFLGRITAQKGPALFLHAARSIASRFASVRFVMAGEGDLLPSMRWLACELGLASKVHFPGFLTGDARARAFDQADCFALTSTAEPFGIAALEAVQHGLPAVVPPDSGVAEGVPALATCDPRRTDELADAISTLLFDQRRATQTALAATAQARTLTWDRTALECSRIHDQSLRPS